MSRQYLFPFNAPANWRIQAIQAYEQYLSERDDDISAGREPSTDDVQPWSEFVQEYLGSELEHAAQ